MTSAEFPTVWKRQLNCYLRGYAYDYERRVLQLRVPRFATLRMDGAIRFAKRIDPNVVHIIVHEEHESGIEYILLEGDWVTLFNGNILDPREVWVEP